jgi:SAM-dependent methyltransferase
VKLDFERAKATPLGDVRYNARHERRNRARVRAITDNCMAGEAALDIGCNAGYFSRALLDRGLAQTIDAIEYDPSIVADDLKTDPLFSLYSGDAIDFPFKNKYHTTIYGAVHHHLFALHGYERAMQFWSKVVEHTETTIFLESGQMAEGCRWYWQRALRKYYSSDEDYFADLVYSIGPRLKELRLVGRYWIHGVPRWLFKIDLWPFNHSTAQAREEPQVQIEASYKRTIGSTDQRLILTNDIHGIIVHEGVLFHVGNTLDGRKVFCKNYLINENEKQELAIADQVHDQRFVMPIGHSSTTGLVYPFVDLPILATVPRLKVKDKVAMSQALLSLFQYADEKHIIIEFGGARKMKLIDVVDIHAANIFFDEAETSFQVFDLEFYSLANRPRNQLHFAGMLYRWGARDLRTLTAIAANLVSYCFGLAKIALRRPDRRVIERTVSVPWWAYTRFREALDKCIIVIIPRFRE